MEGRVVDGTSLTPIAGARVVAGQSIVITDVDGRFLLRLPLGDQRLDVSAPGYLDTPVPISVQADDTPPVEILLFSQTILSQTVEVRGETPRPEGPSTTEVTPEEVFTVPGSIDNIYRTLDTLPGVAATEDFGSRLSVRGGAPDQNLTLMDGAEIHNPYRLFGLTSAFNPETIERFDLTAGGFSSRYGDRLSSLLVIETRDGAPTVGGSLSTSVTDANIVVEGPTPGPGRGTFLFTGRRTYYDLVANRVTDNNFPSFGDLQLKSSWEIGPGHRLSILGLTSRENSDFTIESDSRPEDTGALLSDIGNDLVSVRFDAVLGGRASSRTVVSWYRNREFVDFDGRFRQEAKRSNAVNDEIGFGQSAIIFDRELTVRDVSVRQELSLEAAPRHLLNAGVELHRLRSGVGFTTAGDRNISEANGSSVRGGAGLPDQLASTLTGTRGGAWIEDRYQASSRWTLEPGVRLEWSSVNGGWEILPRLATQYALTDDWRLRGALGLFAQSPGYEKLIQSDYFIDLSQVRQLGIDHERAFHAIGGFERTLGREALVRLEGYYKRFDDLIVGRLETDAERQARLSRYDFPVSLQDSIPTQRLITSTPSNGGAGRAYGLDLFLARTDPAARLSGWMSYTLGWADQEAYGQSYPFDYDRRHALNLVGRYRVSPKWDLGVTGRIASGFTRTDVQRLRVAAVEDGRGRLIPETDAEGSLVYALDFGGVSNLNRGRLPHYARFDLRGTYRPGGLTGRWSIYVEVINALGRDNPVEMDTQLAHDPEGTLPRLIESPTAGFPRIPTFGVRFRF